MKSCIFFYIYWLRHFLGIHRRQGMHVSLGSTRNRDTALLNVNWHSFYNTYMPLKGKLLHEHHTDIKNCGCLILFESGIWGQKIIINHQIASTTSSLMPLDPIQGQ